MKRFIYRLNKEISVYFSIASSVVLSHWKFFLFGLFFGVIFIVFLLNFNYMGLVHKQEIIGIVGNYTQGNLPRFIQDEISSGLVDLDSKFLPKESKIASWKEENSGKKYIFKIKPNIFWQDGSPLTASDINFNLKGVSLTKKGNDTLEFELQKPFSPFLVYMSQPIYKKGLVGLGEKKVTGIKYNNRFIQSLYLDSTVYKFYPSEIMATTALKLGEIQKIKNLNSLSSDLTTDYKTTSSVDFSKIVVLFFNTQKEPFVEKSFRQGLLYALPENFFDFNSAYGPFHPNGWVSQDSAKRYSQNLENARKLISKTATSSSDLKINLVTTEGLKNTAEIVLQAWKNIGLNCEVSYSEILPNNFDVYLSYLEIPLDPDQYLLWHSTRETNISGYKSPKIDKLLEEGREISNIIERKDIYSQFQRALTEDAPVGFLYYPKTYTIERR